MFNRNTWLDETVEHTAKAFLGLTFNCAKCHDHKYDPIPQADYYRFRAFFEPYQVRTDRLPGETDFEKDGLPRVFDGKLDAPTYLFKRGNEKDLDKEHPLKPGVPAALGGTFEITPVELAARPAGIRTSRTTSSRTISRPRRRHSRPAIAALSKLKDAAEDDPKRRVAELKVDAERAEARSAEGPLGGGPRRSISRGGCGAGEDLVAARLEREANVAAGRTRRAPEAAGPGRGREERGSRSRPRKTRRPRPLRRRPPQWRRRS